MSESLHEAAMRFTGHRGCKGGCSNCDNGDNRDDNGVCLIRRIAQCGNAEEQIEWLKDWRKKNPPKPKWVISEVYACPGESVVMYACGNCGFRPCIREGRIALTPYKYCPSCGFELGGIE